MNTPLVRDHSTYEVLIVECDVLVWYDRACCVFDLVLNCVRMLIRIIPFLFEHAQWRDLFWSPIALSEVQCLFVCVCVCVCVHTYVYVCVHACVLV